MDHHAPTESQSVQLELVMRKLHEANLGGLPCDRIDCSACSKLGAGATVMPVPRTAPTTPAMAHGLPPIAYTSTLVPGLRFAPEDAKVLAAVQDGIHEDARLWRLNLDANRLALLSGFDELICLPLVRGIRKYDYQIATAFKVLRELRGRALLADEVGLGKTVEAGLILKEYVVRGLVRKALVLVPASLTVQWQSEMREKFGISFEIMDEVEDWERHAFVIASLDTAKRPGNQEVIEKLYYDLVIVDEAHKVRNRRTRNWKFVSSIRKKYILMLTATPVQNDLEELFNLVTLLKPGQMRSWGEFRREFFQDGDRRTPAHPADLRSLLREVMIRNRRGDAIVLPPRRVDSIEVPLSPPERALYDGVSAFVRRWFRSGPLSNRLSLMVLQREIGSSPAAARETMKRMRESPNFSWEERAELDQLYQKSVTVEKSARGEQLVRLLHATRDQVIVFTQYYRTLAWLAERLRREALTCTTFHGGMSPMEKEASVQSFKDGVQVFLSTEAGGEGRNLQFAHRLVNFDLPWNPLRLEQRIGRIHRIGQTQEVHIVNLWSRDTVEEYVLELLDKKVHLFELVVGELDMILGNLDEKKSFEDLLMEIWAIEDAAKRQAAVESLGERLANARSTYAETKLHDERLFGSDLEVGVGVAG